MNREKSERIYDNVDIVRLRYGGYREFASSHCCLGLIIILTNWTGPRLGPNTDVAPTYARSRAQQGPDWYRLGLAIRYDLVDFQYYTIRGLNWILFEKCG